MTLSAGTKLGPYEILAPIGAGGMGAVYRAKDPRLGREVAIKVLPSTFSQDADRLKRFEQEARAAGVLNHPGITAVYDIGTASDQSPYIVTELLEGETLRAMLARGPMSWLTTRSTYGTRCSRHHTTAACAANVLQPEMTTTSGRAWRNARQMPGVTG